MPPQREYQLKRLSRLFAALSQVNRAISQSQDRQKLFSNVCQILTQEAGFRLSWIGWANAENVLEPVAYSTDSFGYLKDFKVSTEADKPEGRGPTGTAFREQKAYVCNDMLADPVTIPWRNKIIESNFKASAVFPIILHGKSVGAISVYSDVADYFQDLEVQLLQDSAVNISFAVESMQREEMRIQAEESLKAERLFTDSMLQSMPGILYFYDKDLKFLRWNKNMEEVTGYSTDEFTGISPLDLFSEADRPYLTRQITEVFEKGESTAEADLLTKDGRSIPYLFTGRRITLNGETYLIGMGIDVSVQKQAIEDRKRSEDSYQTLFDHAPDGILIADPAGNYLDANESISKMLGYDRKDIIGKNAEHIVMPEEFVKIEPAIDQINSTSEYYREWKFRRKNGTSFPAEVIATTMPDGNIMAMVRDISERKAAELALRQLNESLEHRISERTQELKLALTRAESADRLKSSFLATMSHELRTPLNSIIGFTGIILQGLAGPLTEEQSKQLGMVRGSARHLLELINDVLDLSKIEANLLIVSTETFDLHTSINRVVATTKPLADHKGLSIDVHLPVPGTTWVSDRRRLEQILLNLINNAIKFTDKGRIQVQAEVFLDSGKECLSIKVKDTGIGIKTEDIPLLFQPFRQIDSGLTRQHEGTGLGLAICQRLAQLLGGQITVASQWQHGSEFQLILPLKEMIAT